MQIPIECVSVWWDVSSYREKAAMVQLHLSLQTSPPSLYQLKIAVEQVREDSKSARAHTHTRTYTHTHAHTRIHNTHTVHTHICI